MSDQKNIKNKRDAIRRISRDTDMSESSIYKILSNPLNFSKSTVDTVRRVAERYGLTPGGEGTAAATEGDSLHRYLRIGVVIPSRPLYFWREAVAGIEKGKGLVEAQSAVTVQLRYIYYGGSSVAAEEAVLFDALETDALDGLILFPVEGEYCRRFIENTHIPTVIFNDILDCMTASWFDAHPHAAFIGPDGYEEGKRAAAVMSSCSQSIRHLAVWCIHGNYGERVSGQRIRGMCDHARELFPDIRISRVERDPLAQGLTPAVLARRLIDCYETGNVDCLYIPSGVTHIACAAIEKIERRLGRPLATFVIGHEYASADSRYLMEGRQRGYIKQDVYSQGLNALQDVVAACLYGAPLTERKYPSSVFIR